MQLIAEWTKSQPLLLLCFKGAMKRLFSCSLLSPAPLPPPLYPAGAPP